MLSGPGSLSRSMRFSVIGMSSAIWDKKMCKNSRLSSYSRVRISTDRDRETKKDRERQRETERERHRLSGRATLRPGDSPSILGAVTQLRSRTPGLATVIRELALQCGRDLLPADLGARPRRTERLGGRSLSSLATRTNEQFAARPSEG